MERLEKTSRPAKKLSDEQRAEIAHIEKVYERLAGPASILIRKWARRPR